MGYNKNPRIEFNCHKCGKKSSDRPSHFKKKKRHFCSMKCYALFRKEDRPKEEHERFGSGFTESERRKRLLARSILNHYLRDKKKERGVCEVCGSKAEAHHDDYNKPLEVRWLCFKHHRQYHHENPDLIQKVEM